MRNFYRTIGLATLAPLAALAVSLSADGRGQALVFPYYSVRSTSEGDYNTYFALTNASNDVKAVRFALRESKAGRAVMELNVFLAPGDVWTLALVPDAAGVRILTTDASCTDPKIPAAGVAFGVPNVTPPPDDGLGHDAQRAREGYAEAIELGTLQGISGLVGLPRTCTGMPTAAQPATLAGPTGGLTGSGNVIHVASGFQLEYTATALDQLASAPHVAFSGASIGFDSPAVDPVSVVVDNGVMYRSHWQRGVDAVSAVLMAAQLEGEFVADAAIRAKTDWVMAFPTRRFYVTPTSSSGPFGSIARVTAQPGAANCNWMYEFMQLRDSSGFTSIAFPEHPPSGTYACYSVVVGSFRGTAGAGPLDTSDVLGSANTPTIWLGRDGPGGWAFADFTLTSAILTPNDTLAFDPRTGVSTPTGRTYAGLPVTGFAAVTFTNGFLNCAGATCRGNYAGTTPLRPRRSLLLPGL